MIKKGFVLLAILVVVLSCGKKSETIAGTEKLSVITSNFALYDFVRIVGGEQVTVELLLPPGVEAHSYEPTPRDMVRVGSSDLFVCIGTAVEPWVGKIVDGAALDSSVVVETGRGVTFLKHAHGEHDDHDSHDDCSGDSGKSSHDAETNALCGGHNGDDPHIWLDPIRAQQMVAGIVEALSARDTVHAEEYRSRGDSLHAELQGLHERFVATIDSADSRTIMYAGHFAFGYFADRYGLEYVSPYAGFSPNSEPTPAKIAELINRVRNDSVSTIFYEELVEPRIARIIIEDTGVSMALLHGIHNVASRELQGDFSYLKGMEENRLRLAEGLRRVRN